MCLPVSEAPPLPSTEALPHRRDVRLGSRFFGLGSRFRNGLHDLALLLELRDARIDEAVQIAERRGHEREKLRDRCDDRTDELPTQDVDGRQRRQSRSTSSPESDLPSSIPPRSVRTFVSFAVAASAFATAAGSPDDSMNAIAVGPSSMTSSASAPACSAARRVSVFLTIRNRAPCGSSCVAQRLELLVRQPAVVRDDERVGRAELRGQLLDDPFLVGFQHVISS